MESKFKIGDEIYFMSYTRPTKGKIEGIAFVVGKFNNSVFKKTGTHENPSITYHTGGYDTVDEGNAYATKEELQIALFANL